MKPMGPVFGWTKPDERTKMQENSKNCKQFAKTQITEAIKIISYYLNIMNFDFIFLILTQLKLY